MPLEGRAIRWADLIELLHRLPMPFVYQVRFFSSTVAACGFAALLVVILKSEPIKELVTGVIQTALGLGG